MNKLKKIISWTTIFLTLSNTGFYYYGKIWVYIIRTPIFPLPMLGGHFVISLIRYGRIILHKSGVLEYKYPTLWICSLVISKVAFWTGPQNYLRPYLTQVIQGLEIFPSPLHHLYSHLLLHYFLSAKLPLLILQIPQIYTFSNFFHSVY